MPSPISAGVLLYRRVPNGADVLLVLPGGPYWRGKGAGAWMIPKGGIEPGESAAEAAAREFREELGSDVPGPLVPLSRIRQAGGKYVDAFAVEGDLDADAIVSNSFELEWPPRSGKRATFPEVARAAWFPLTAAHDCILPSQRPLLDELESLLRGGTT